MIYKLDKQIWNERLHNLWIWAEMFVVSVVLWYIVDNLYVIYSIYNQPKGQNIEHTYQIMTDILLPSNPEYVSPEISKRSSGEDVIEIANRLRQRDDVESVCISMWASPYNDNYTINVLKFDSTTYRSYLIREVSPDYFNVFRCEMKNGGSMDDAIKTFKESPNNVMISTDFLPDTVHLEAGSSLVSMNNNQQIHVAGILKQFKQLDYREEPRDQAFTHLTDPYISGIEESFSRALEISVRVKPEKDNGFSERLLNEADEHYRVGNRFIKTVRSMEFIRRTIQMDSSNDIRNRLAICGFLLLNIFFGLLGTFWFRTQQRRKEMALHRVIGCTQGQIFGRLIAEGIFLLAIATIPALFADGFIAKAGLTESLSGETFTCGRFAATTGISFLLMGIMVVIGISIPALQARRLELTTTLQEY